MSAATAKIRNRLQIMISSLELLKNHKAINTVDFNKMMGIVYEAKEGVEIMEQIEEQLSEAKLVEADFMDEYNKIISK